jgi:hypothetical protein
LLHMWEWVDLPAILGGIVGMGNGVGDLTYGLVNGIVPFNVDGVNWDWWITLSCWGLLVGLERAVQWHASVTVTILDRSQAITPRGIMYLCTGVAGFFWFLLMLRTLSDADDLVNAEYEARKAAILAVNHTASGAVFDYGEDEVRAGAAAAA